MDSSPRRLSLFTFTCKKVRKTSETWLTKEMGWRSWNFVLSSTQVSEGMKVGEAWQWEIESFFRFSVPFVTPFPQGREVCMFVCVCVYTGIADYFFLFSNLLGVIAWKPHEHPDVCICCSENTEAEAGPTYYQLTEKDAPPFTPVTVRAYLFCHTLH